VTFPLPLAELIIAALVGAAGFALLLTMFAVGLRRLVLRHTIRTMDKIDTHQVKMNCTVDRLLDQQRELNKRLKMVEITSQHLAQEVVKLRKRGSGEQSDAVQQRVVH
jgi:uncharacterized protein YdcH (DUF465 family)